MENKKCLYEKTLKEFKPGESGTVLKVIGEGPIKRRLFDMGITPGTVIKLRKTAPLGDPIELSLRGYQLSIRKSEAEAIFMSKSIQIESGRCDPRGCGYCKGGRFI